MGNHLRFEVVVSYGHAQRVDNQLGAHMFGDRVPDAFLMQQLMTVAR